MAQAERGCVRLLWQWGHSATTSGDRNIPAHRRQNSHSIARSPNSGSEERPLATLTEWGEAAAVYQGPVHSQQAVRSLQVIGASRQPAVTPATSRQLHGASPCRSSSPTRAPARVPGGYPGGAAHSSAEGVLGTRWSGFVECTRNLLVLIATTPLPRPVQSVTGQPEQVVCHGGLACAIVIVGVRVLVLWRLARLHARRGAGVVYCSQRRCVAGSGCPAHRDRCDRIRTCPMVKRSC